MQTYVGTSGYQYKGWTDAFYPSSVKKKDWLPYYASQFDTVEINSSFYRLPEAKTFADWSSRVPADFRFAIKGSRYITHQKRLVAEDQNVSILFDRATALGDKLGVVLWQMPQFLRYNQDKLETFCNLIANHPAAAATRHAFEFRHESWFCDETYDLLRKYNHALVMAHSNKWPCVDIATADWLYIRFHGAPRLYTSDYSDAKLAKWADQIIKHNPKTVFAFFNNDVNVRAPENAKTLRQLLGQGKS